jgi:hypothetical protein
VFSFWQVRNIPEGGDNGVRCPFGKYVIYRQYMGSCPHGLTTIYVLIQLYIHTQNDYLK